MSLFAIDARSIAVFSILNAVTVVFAMTYNWRSRKTFRGFGLWAAASCAYVVGQTAFILQGLVPAWLGIVLSNAILALGFQWVLRGIWRFGGKEPGPAIDIAAVASATIAAAFFTYAHPSLKWRIVSFCAMSFCQTTASLVGVYSLAKRSRMKVNASLVAGFISVLAISSIRAGLALSFGTGAVAFVLDSAVQATMLMLYSGAYMLVFIGLFIQNAQRVEDELRKAAEEVKTLSGIIPICSHCKKVRNDSGYWEQVEAYVSSRTDADFSHGICPDCLEKHYPEQADLIRKKGKD